MEWKRDLDFRDPGFSMIDQTLLMINVYNWSTITYLVGNKD